MRPVAVVAVAVGVIVGAIAWQAPRPADAVGSVACGVAAGLLVLVVYLFRRVADNGRRLDAIERVISEVVDDDER